MTRSPYLIPATIVVALGLAFYSILSAPFNRSANSPGLSSLDSEDESVPTDVTTLKVNRWFEQQWKEESLSPAPKASDLLVLRRLSLTLHGTIPSLEEIRAFEADTKPEKLKRWTRKLLQERRFASYFAERLARAYVGTDEGAFLVFRRDRLTDWLREQLHENRPYNEIVSDLISAEGIWTGKPAVNFITGAYANDLLNHPKLTARTVRAFLGQRIDCAQCHDHPFANWKQSEFEGLTAFYGQTDVTFPFGVVDRTTREGKPMHYAIEDIPGEEKRIIEPKVPFHSDWISNQSSRRKQLASWITHPDNRRFERAITNRVWALLFGRSFYPGLEIDDMPDPGEPDVIDIIAEDFRLHGYDLKRLVEIIASCDPFLRSSTYGHLRDTSTALASESLSQLATLHQTHQDFWAVFPISNLRPEQLVSAMGQSASIKTVDSDSHLIVRFIRWTRQNDFLKEYGDLGEDEFVERAGTVTQALFRMNGQLPAEMLEANLFNATGRLVDFEGTDEERFEAACLMCLIRRPNQKEKELLLPPLQAAKSKKEKKQVMEDLFWTFYNVLPEFSHHY